MYRIIFPFLMFLVLLGCATQYKTVGFSGGYSETQIDENIFRVSFRGNGYTSLERSSDFCLLRSAELSLLNGFNYFIIIDENSYSSTTTYTTPTRSKTSLSATTYGNTTYGTASTTTYGGQTYYISKPRSSNTIICFVEKPELNVMFYNAKFIFDSIRKKYGIVDSKDKR